MTIICFRRQKMLQIIPIFYENNVHFVETFSRRTYFLVTAVPSGSENSHNVVQLNSDEDKYNLLSSYPTFMPPLKKFSPESIRAIAKKPNIYFQSIVIYSRSDRQHHFRTQHFQEFLTEMDTVQSQTIDQNLRKTQKPQDFQISMHKTTVDTLKM